MFKSILKLLLYLIVSLLLALVIRLFLCNFYHIPSNSMEPTIMPGDFILTNKWTYGARIFTKLKFDKDNDPPIVRVPGLGQVKRNDVMVFNFPYRAGWDTIRMNMNLIFMKRCVGLPGDSLSIINSYYRIAGITDTLGYIPEQKRLAQYREVLDSTIMRTYPFDTLLFKWDIRNFGPLYIPAAGATIDLTPGNFTLYHKQITFETRSAVYMKDSSVYINDTLRTNYTFRHNWYFVAGDNVLNSQDSRYIGLIPETYIIGKASLILSSKDIYSGKRNWGRMMKVIR